MKLSAIKELVPDGVVSACELDEDVRYLVTIPDTSDEVTFHHVARALKEAGLKCVVVPDTMKFFELPE